MTVEQYRASRAARLQAEVSFRERCPKCHKSLTTCFCVHLRPFFPKTKFVILIHRDEVKRSIATGRMAHLCLENSMLIPGYEFTHNDKVNAILNDKANYPVVLYPGKTATNLSDWNRVERMELFPADKQLVVFVLDATWAQAKRMKRFSKNLENLPLICFTPPRLSQFRVRKQPKPHCFSTIEAIHEVIELLEGEGIGNNAHENMIQVFNAMVEQQLKYRDKFEPTRTCRETKRSAVIL